jgi:hypothetical protein
MSLVQTAAFLSYTIQYLKQQNTDTETLSPQTEVRCVHSQTDNTDNSSDIITDFSGCCVTFYNICINVRSNTGTADSIYGLDLLATSTFTGTPIRYVSQSDTTTSVTAVQYRKTGNKEAAMSLPPPTLEYCVANNRGSALNSLIIPIHL